MPARVPPLVRPIPEPKDLRSVDGVLRLDLTIHNAREPDGSVRYCYLLADGTQSPTLRLRPGDELVLNLKNNLTDVDAAAAVPAKQHGHGARGSAGDPCTSGAHDGDVHESALSRPDGAPPLSPG